MGNLVNYKVTKLNGETISIKCSSENLRNEISKEEKEIPIDELILEIQDNRVILHHDKTKQIEQLLLRIAHIEQQQDNQEKLLAKANQDVLANRDDVEIIQKKIKSIEPQYEENFKHLTTQFVEQQNSLAYFNQTIKEQQELIDFQQAQLMQLSDKLKEKQ